MDNSSVEVSQQKNDNSGLHLNKKSIFGIFILLAAILVFAGILTQTMPRGEYYSYPKNTCRLENGDVVTVRDENAVYTVDGKTKIGFDEYVARLKEAGVKLKTVNEADSVQGEDVSEMIIDGTYHSIDYKMPVWKIALSMILVFGSKDVTTGIAIILFIILIGGTFLILDEQGVLKYIMAFIIRKFESRKYFLLCMMIFVFMLLSSTAGTLEESVTLVPIAAAISLALGWDSLVGLTISLVAIAFGFTAATFNPFNVITVQRLAGIPIFSGLWLRIIIFVLVYAVLAGFTLIYAKKIEKNPEKSISRETDMALREKYKLEDSLETLSNPAIKKATRAFVICLSLVLVCIILDFILDLSGYLSMPGMAVLFTVGGLLAGKKSGLKGRELFSGFRKGVVTIAPAIPLIFFILAITYILREGMIIHTILHFVYGLVSGLSSYSAVLLLFGFIVLLEFFIGSGTAKAFLIMPIVAPLSQLIGISGNTVVITFCMGDGFTNLLYPTSGIMIIAIGLLNISYGKWLKYSWKLFVAEGFVAVAMMHLALFINYI